MFCQSCGAPAPEGGRFCQKCGIALHPSSPGAAQQPGQQLAAQPGQALQAPAQQPGQIYTAQQQTYAPPPPPGGQPYYPPPPIFGSTMVYDELFDLNQIPPDLREQYKRHGFFDTFSVGGAIVLHFITFGIFTLIFMGLKHSKFPRIRPDDFGAGKAIGFMFIPFLNIYWIFVFWLRLADRINFQFKLRNQAPAVNRGLVLAAVIVGIIPYVGLISWLIIYPIVISEVQGACNALALQSMAERAGVAR
jgi:hypothetical protein